MMNWKALEKAFDDFAERMVVWGRWGILFVTIPLLLLLLVLGFIGSC